MQKRRVFKYSIVVSICLCITLGMWHNVFGAVEEESTPEELQQQLISLRKEFKLRIEKAEKDRQLIYENIRQKLKEIGKKQGSLNTSQPELIKQIKALLSELEKYSKQIDGFEKTLDTMEKAMDQSLNTIEKRVTAIKKQGIHRTPAAPAEPAEPVQPEAPPLDFSPGQLFRLAYRYYMDGDYETAIAGFYKFLQEYPDSQLAGAAQYWIAESLAKLEEYDIALQEYNRLIKTYPRNDKISDAHYGIGVALLKLGRSDEAEAKFTYVISNFSGTIAARKAQNRLDELR